MDSTTLQIPLAKNLKAEATFVAREQGFSSLQELIRVFLTQVAKRKLTVNVGIPTMQLSSAADRRYQRLDRDFARAKNTQQADNLDELIERLQQ